MTSVQENLARVRAGLAHHNSDDATHSRILTDHAAAIREHEHDLRTQRDKLHRKRKCKDDHRFRFKSSRLPQARQQRPKSRVRSDDEVDAITSHPLPRPSSEDLTLDHRASHHPPSDPDTAFATSLFDALADDEGAASYWEAVYSQPVHIYERPSAADGSLEAMTDAEYAAYVKQRMWERLHPEEARDVAHRAEQRAERQKSDRKRTARKLPQDHDPLGVQAALDRGEARKQARRWTQAWQTYQGLWHEDVNIEALPWPTLGGHPPGDRSAEVQTFFAAVIEHVLPSLVDSDKGEIDVAKRMLLKAERFRWHPDKMLQRFGEDLQERPGILASITGVFQVVDGMLGGTKQ